eukprot:tig00022080_g23800.t1
MGSKIEYVSAEGLRVDGRRPHEIRNIRCKLGVLSHTDGSVYLEMGNTKVIAAVYGPREVERRRDIQYDDCVVTCEFGMAPFSTGERKKRGRTDRRSMELAMFIRETLQSAIMGHLLPRSQISVFLQVLQADGGTRSACVNAASLALMDAGVPMRDFLCAVAAGYVDGTPILDMNYIEEGAGGPNFPVAVLPRSGRLVSAQMDNKVPADVFEKVLALAVEGCKQVCEVLRAAAREHTANLANARGVMAF